LEVFYSKLFGGCLEIDVLDFFDKLEYVTACMAAMAIENLLIRIDRVPVRLFALLDRNEAVRSPGVALGRYRPKK